MIARRWATALAGAAFGFGCVACSGSNQFHPLPSQADVLERDGPTTSAATTHASDFVSNDAPGDLEGKIDESLATLYALLERQAALAVTVDALRSRATAPTDVVDEFDELDEEIRAAQRALDASLDEARPDTDRAAEFEGVTMLVDVSGACADVYETPSDTFDALFCAPSGTPIFRCETFDRVWTRGLVYHRGIVHEVFIAAESLRELEANRRDLTR